MAKVLDILANLSLVDQAFVLGVDKLDGSSSVKNVFSVLAVDVVQHRRIV